jgi:hypothetical protein
VVAAQHAGVAIIMFFSPCKSSAEPITVQPAGRSLSNQLNWRGRVSVDGNGGEAPQVVSDTLTTAERLRIGKWRSAKSKRSAVSCRKIDRVPGARGSLLLGMGGTSH